MLDAGVGIERDVPRRVIDQADGQHHPQLAAACLGQLTAGLVYDPAGNVALDPDTGVQHAIRHVFASFERTGSARAAVGVCRRERLSFPTRVRTGERKGELAWMPLRHWRVLRTLHNPRYAGGAAASTRALPCAHRSARTSGTAAPLSVKLLHHRPREDPVRSNDANT